MLDKKAVQTIIRLVKVVTEYYEGQLAMHEARVEGTAKETPDFHKCYLKHKKKISK